MNLSNHLQGSADPSMLLTGAAEGKVGMSYASVGQVRIGAERFGSQHPTISRGNRLSIAIMSFLNSFVNASKIIAITGSGLMAGQYPGST